MSLFPFLIPVVMIEAKKTANFVVSFGLLASHGTLGQTTRTHSEQ